MAVRPRPQSGTWWSLRSLPAQIFLGFCDLWTSCLALRFPLSSGSDELLAQPSAAPSAPENPQQQLQQLLGQSGAPPCTQSHNCCFSISTFLSWCSFTSGTAPRWQRTLLVTSKPPTATPEHLWCSQRWSHWCIQRISPSSGQNPVFKHEVIMRVEVRFQGMSPVLQLPPPLSPNFCHSCSKEPFCSSYSFSHSQLRSNP